MDPRVKWLLAKITLCIALILIAACQTEDNNIKIISSNPEQYLGQNVTVRGTASLFTNCQQVNFQLIDAQGYFIGVKVPDNRILIVGSEQSVTGIVKNSTKIYPLGEPCYYIDST